MAGEKRALTWALPKGRLLPPTLKFLKALGLDPSGLKEDSRRLVMEDPGHGMRYILSKPADVLTFVEHGAADLGIVGQDVLREMEGDVLEPALLGFGRCRMSVAGREELTPGTWALATGLRVATQYPRLARDWFTRRGLAIEIIPLAGSVELAPAIGLADLLVDVVDTGRTLRENGLVEHLVILESEATLVVNRASQVTRWDEIHGLLERIRSLEGEPGAH